MFCVILSNSIALQADYVTVVDVKSPQNKVYQLHLAKTEPRSSRTLSLRQLSFLYCEVSYNRLIGINCSEKGVVLRYFVECQVYIYHFM